MAITNHERIGRAFELLKTGLAPFVEREILNTYKERAPSEMNRLAGEDRLIAEKPVTV